MLRWGPRSRGEGGVPRAQRARFPVLCLLRASPSMPTLHTLTVPACLSLSLPKPWLSHPLALSSGSYCWLAATQLSKCFKDPTELKYCHKGAPSNWFARVALFHSLSERKRPVFVGIYVGRSISVQTCGRVLGFHIRRLFQQTLSHSHLQCVTGQNVVLICSPGVLGPF